MLCFFSHIRTTSDEGEPVALRAEGARRAGRGVGLVPALVATPANTHDRTVAGGLLHGGDRHPRG